MHPETFGITITIGRLSDDEDKSFEIVKKMLGYLGLKQFDSKLKNPKGFCNNRFIRLNFISSP